MLPAVLSHLPAAVDSGTAHALLPPHSTASSSHSVVAAVEAVRHKWNVRLTDVSKENEFWGHSQWPEAAEMNDAQNGVFSLSWMDLDGNGAPDLFVKWHGGGSLILLNDGLGDFKLHRTQNCDLATNLSHAMGHHGTVHLHEKLRPSLVWSIDCVDAEGNDLPSNHSCWRATPFANGTSSHCTPQYFDGHGAIAVDLDNDGKQEVFVAVGGAQGHLDCSGPRLEDCRYPNSTLKETLERYARARKRSGNAIYAPHVTPSGGHFLRGGQRGGHFAGVDGLGQRSHLVMAADFNFDGLVDLLVGNYVDKAFPVGTHPSRIWLQQQHCTGGRKFCFSDADQLGYEDPTGSERFSVKCNDLGEDSCGQLRNIQVFNNNTHTGGFTHLLQHEAGLLTLQSWDGHRFKLSSAFTFRTGSQKACRILLGDFDGDGKLEALACHGFHLRSELALFQTVADMFSGAGPKQRIESAGSSRNIAPVAVADFDNDGDLDALAVESWTDPAGSAQARLRVLENNGRGRLTMSTGPTGCKRTLSPGHRTDKMVMGFVGVVADVDRDGRMDVAVNDAGSRVMLFKNASPRRPWICVSAQGTRSNRGAIGALIRISQGDRVARRDVSASSPAQDYGGVSCSGLWEDAPARVQVCWPRGDDAGCEDFGSLPINTTHVLQESSDQVIADQKAAASPPPHPAPPSPPPPKGDAKLRHSERRHGSSHDKSHRSDGHGEPR